MSESQNTVSREEAARQVLSIVNRLALLHHSYARTLIDELGEKKGKEIALKAIRSYGETVGKSVRKKTLAKGLEPLKENYQEDLPLFGWDIKLTEKDGETRALISECFLAKTWKELGAPELGRLYCWMDQAKYEAYNPELECVHVSNILDGAPACELAIRKKTKK